MYTPVQLEAIRIFGRKNLSFGCKVILSNPRTGEILDTYPHTVIAHSEGYYTDFIPRATRNKDSIKSCEILGHEPHLEDLFRLAEEKNKIKRFEMNIDRNSLGVLVLRFYSDVGNWNANQVIEGYNTTLPLLEQSEETLKQLISLFE